MSEASKSDNQATGNIGLFFVCYQLARRGWNVLPTTRNARGIDILIYGTFGRRKWTIQVKSLSKRAPVPLGQNLDHLFADFVVVCSRVSSEQPKVYVLAADDVRDGAFRSDRDGKVSYWLQPDGYDQPVFHERWELLGTPEDRGSSASV